MRSLVRSCLLLSLLGLVIVGAGGAARTSWAAPEIRAMVAAGAMRADASGFRPDDQVTAGELADALAALGWRTSVPVEPWRPLTMRELDARLVTALGLRPAATSIRVAARAAGLRPTAYLGTETIARVLGLRRNHPVGQEDLERRPSDPASRAEAAYSLARAHELGANRGVALAEAVQSLSFAGLNQAQAAVVSRALRFVGYPYVFAGSSERRQQIWSSGGPVWAPPGFDCSGLVWRVFKLEPIAVAPGLGGVIEGRTTFAMSGEVERAARIARAALEPGDILFFGARGVRSTPAEVTHSGIYVGPGWFVHSSTNGVTLQPLSGWYETRFAWGRRPLAEAASR